MFILAWLTLRASHQRSAMSADRAPALRDGQEAGPPPCRRQHSTEEAASSGGPFVGAKGTEEIGNGGPSKYEGGGKSVAMRRRERQLRSFGRHVAVARKIAWAEATHHSAQPVKVPPQAAPDLVDTVKQLLQEVSTSERGILLQR